MMGSSDRKAWRLETAAILGVVFGCFATYSVVHDNYLDTALTFLGYALAGAVVFTTVAYLRNRGIASMPEGFPRHILGTENGLAAAEPAIVAVDISDEELESRRAAENFRKHQQKHADKRNIHDESLISARAKIAKADKFVRDSYLDQAIPYLYNHMEHWPTWSKRDDAARWIAPLPITDLAGGSPASGQKYIEWRAEGRGYRISFKRRSYTSMDTNTYADFTLEVDGELVFAFSGARSELVEWDNWHYSVLDTLKVGPWVSEIVDLYSQLLTWKETQRRNRDAEFRAAKAANIDFGEDV